MKGFVYILTNVTNSVLYTGVTSDIKNRLRQHKSRKHINSFTARYNLTKLVYVEEFNSIGEAIKREKQIKAGSRKKKVNLVTGMNPDWDDLIRIVEDQ
ncbi:MAG: GIY-YIG nuclease family protein [Bacteroidia bacterium]|nr:GIY-YIG nuclease family protein [Bacteroidia bacterium]